MRTRQSKLQLLVVLALLTTISRKETMGLRNITNCDIALYLAVRFYYSGGILVTKECKQTCACTPCDHAPNQPTIY